MIEDRKRSLACFSNFKIYVINSKTAVKGVALNAVQSCMEL